MSVSKIPLSEVLAELRSELFEAAQAGQGHEIRFVVEEAEVELETAVTKDAEVGGGVKFWVYNAEAKGKLGSEQTQRIRLRLTPVDSKGKKRLISARRRRQQTEVE